MPPSSASQPDGAALTTADASTPTSSAAATAPIRKAHRLPGIPVSANRVEADYLWGPGRGIRWAPANGGGGGAWRRGRDLSPLNVLVASYLLSLPRHPQWGPWDGRLLGPHRLEECAAGTPSGE